MPSQMRISDSGGSVTFLNPLSVLSNLIQFYYNTPATLTPRVDLSLDGFPRFKIDVVAPSPVILSQPISLEVNLNQNVSFTVRAQGSNQAALSFQWYKKTTPIPGATSSTLTLSYVREVDSGLYSCMVSETGAIASTTSSGPLCLCLWLQERRHLQCSWWL
jgi:hypothetical protein